MSRSIKMIQKGKRSVVVFVCGSKVKCNSYECDEEYVSLECDQNFLYALHEAGALVNATFLTFSTFTLSNIPRAMKYIKDDAMSSIVHCLDFSGETFVDAYKCRTCILQNRPYHQYIN